MEMRYKLLPYLIKSYHIYSPSLVDNFGLVKGFKTKPKRKTAEVVEKKTRSWARGRLVIICRNGVDLWPPAGMTRTALTRPCVDQSLSVIRNEEESAATAGGSCAGFWVNTTRLLCWVTMSFLDGSLNILLISRINYPSLSYWQLRF